MDNNKECGYLDTSPRDFIMGHSSAVRLRSVTFHSLREMMPENIIGHSNGVRLT
jgi:hypothetical protein